MNEKTISLSRVCLSKPVVTTNQQLDIDLYSKLQQVTNRYTIDYRLNTIDQVYIMNIRFSTCKDIFQLIKIFGDEYDIVSHPISTRRIKNDTNDFNNVQ